MCVCFFLTFFFVSCLDDTEMEFLGAPWMKYELAAKDKGMRIIRLPMKEGGCPDTLKEVKDAIIEVNKDIDNGDNVLVHCRGGMYIMLYIYITS